MSILPQKITASQFAALARPDQFAVLRRASARQKLQLLLDAADGEELMTLLPPQDVYLLARELGADQIPELMAMASPEQWTAFFDFDCWDGDHFNSGAARAWLTVLLEGEASHVADTLQAMDFELLVLMLHRDVQVLSGPEEMDDEAAMAEGRRREYGYVLDYRDEEGAKLFGALIDVLFRYAPDFCRYLLEAVRSEGESLLEESVFHHRAGRFLDQGFPEPGEARSVYAWLDPDRFVIGGERKVPLGGTESGAVPGAVLQLAGGRGVLGAALAQGVDEQTAWELACLINKVLMAEQADPGDLDQVRAVAELTCAMLNLALESLTGGDVEIARSCLRDAYAEQLFRFGFSLTVRLQRRARSMQDALIGPYLDAEDRTLLEPLLQRRPRFPVTLEGGGRGGSRPFAALGDMRLVEIWLNRLEVQQRLFAERFPFPLPGPADWELTGCHPDRGAELTLTVIFLTALANRLLGRPFAPLPLAATELAEVHALASRAGRLDPQLREQTLAWLESLEPGAAVFGRRCLDLWEEEFCATRAADLDPRYVGGLIVRRK